MNGILYARMCVSCPYIHEVKIRITRPLSRKRHIMNIYAA